MSTPPEIDLDKEISYEMDIECEVCKAHPALWMSIHPRIEKSGSCFTFFCYICYLSMYREMREAHPDEAVVDCSKCGDEEIEITTIRFERL